jgi:hypothetical protein
VAASPVRNVGVVHYVWMPDAGTVSMCLLMPMVIMVDMQDKRVDGNRLGFQGVVQR